MKPVVLSTICILAVAVAGQSAHGLDVRGAAEPARAGTFGLDDGEFMIDTSTTCVPAPDAQYLPATAFDGDNYLVAWQDQRHNHLHGHIYAARMTPAGAVLDTGGISLGSFGASPKVAFDGDNYLVVWQRGSDSADVRGARVTPGGIVLDSGGFVISAATGGQYGPAVAFDGTNSLVVWYDTRTGCDIYGARVTPAGEVLDTAGIAISTATGRQTYPAVAYDGAGFLVAWQDDRNGFGYDIYGARVTSAGEVLDTAGIAISTATDRQVYPAVASNGANCLVLWQDERGGAGPDVYGTRVNRDGTVLDTTGIAISTAVDWENCPAAAFDGENFLVAWDRGADICGARVTSGGVVLDTCALAVSSVGGAQTHSAVVFGGANYLAVWQDDRGADRDVYGARVTPAGAVLDTAGIIVTIAVDRLQAEPALAFDGTNYLVAWEDYRNVGAPCIRGARVSHDGTVLDPGGMDIAPAADGLGLPAASFGGANFLVVWDVSGGIDRGVYGARVTPAGEVLDSAGIVISTDAWRGAPATACDGTNHLVAWKDSRTHTNYYIYGARVSPAGTVLDPEGFAISADPMWGTDQPAVAFDGTNFLVAWLAKYYSSPFCEIHAARVTPAGEVLDTNAIRISTSTDGEAPPSLAFDGENYLVVWADNWGDGILGARVTQDGEVLDTAGIVISTTTGTQAQPTVVFDGNDYLVVWQDASGGLPSDIYGARVSPDGTVRDEGPVVEQPGDQSCPVLAAEPGSQAFLVYQGLAETVGSITYNDDRVWGRLDPLPGVTETPGAVLRIPDSGPTIVRGVLRIGSQPTADGRLPELLDAAGRKVMMLRPGANDIRYVAPGVYFLRSAVSGERPAVAKVVVTR